MNILGHTRIILLNQRFYEFLNQLMIFLLYLPNKYHATRTASLG